MLLFGLFLYCIGYQDYRSYYVDPKWILISILFLIFQPHHSYLSILSFLYGFVSLYFYKKKQIGSMDVYYLFYFGLYLGYERMCISVMISVLIGILFYLFRKEKLIPYITCLSCGVWISLLKGYTLFYFFV